MTRQDNRRPSRLAPLLAALLAVAVARTAVAAQTTVAVAANFTVPATEIGALFELATGHEAVFSFASTGQLYTQITQGAPFEVFLAADQARPGKAVAEGHAVADSRFTYATGRLVLYSRNASRVSGAATLREPRFERLAIANPVTAPYGAAAVEVMRALEVYERLEKRLVRGNNIAQAFQFVETGNAEVGFVALSQIIGNESGSRWVVPASLHAPIAQDAVLLKRGAGSQAARAFIEFLQGAEARAVTKRFGYGTGD